MWVAIYNYMETMLGISLYSYVYLKLAKILCLSYDILITFPIVSYYVFSLTKLEIKSAGQSGGGLVQGDWWHKICIHL
jgi:hypothetical protein